MLSIQQVQQVYIEAQHKLSQYRSIVDYLHASNQAVSKEIFSGKVPDLWRDAHVGGCNRHMSVFEDLHIIPSFCFNCYKVSIKPDNVVDLIKLQMVFEALNLHENNTRKCSVETRPQISGSYVGLIYCEGKADALTVLEQVKDLVHQKISSDIPVTLKRGCSEFPLQFPDYAEIENQAKELKPEPAWLELEQQHDALHSYTQSKINYQECNEYSNYPFNRALAIMSWLQYASSIEDESYKLITGKSISPIPGLRARVKKGQSNLGTQPAREKDIKKMFSQAYQHQKTGNVAQARKIYRQILKIQPEHLDANHLLGIIASEAGDHNYAEKLFDTCLRKHPDSAEVICNLGNLYFAKGNYSKATEYYERVLRIDASHIKAHMNLATTLQRQEDFHRALKHFQKVLELQPENINACNKLGNMCLQLDRLNDAMTCLNRALEIDKANPETHASIGKLFTKAGELDKAKHHLQLALEINPLIADAYFQLADLLLINKHQDEAIRCYETVLQLRGDEYQAHSRLGELLQLKNRTKQARFHFKQALTINPDYADAQLNLRLMDN